MEYVYAALLLHKVKQPVNEENVKKVVSAAGVTPDDIQVKALVSALGEINIDDALKNAAATPMMAAAPAAASAPAAAKPVEEKKEEKKEEEALEGLSSLFG
jgi:large subunit ribosomal protein L12